jgi:hypothetical protein
MEIKFTNELARPYAFEAFQMENLHEEEIEDMTKAVKLLRTEMNYLKSLNTPMSRKQLMIFKLKLAFLQKKMKEYHEMHKPFSI